MRKEYGCAGVTVLLWSTMPAVSKMLINALSPMSTLCYVSIVAAAVLLLINVARGGVKVYQRYSAPDYGRIFALGFVGMFCYTGFYYIGMESLTSQVAGIINYMWPMMIVIFSCFVLKEKMTKRKGLAMCVSFLGMLVISVGGTGAGDTENSLAGMLLCFLAAVCYGAYSAFNKKYGYDQWIVLNCAFALTAALSAAYCVVADDFCPITKDMITEILWIGIFVNAIAYVLWGIAVNTGDTAKIAILAYICPFLGLIVSWLLLGEQISAAAFAGLVLIIGGVLIQIQWERK